MERYKQKENETSIDYLLRLVGIKLDEKPCDLDWQDIVTYCGLDCHYDSLRKAMQPDYYGAYAIFQYMQKNMITDDEIISQYEKKLQEIYIEKQKIRDMESGIKEGLRHKSRRESILEEMEYYIKDLKPLPVPILKPLNNSDCKFIGGVADCHFGKDLTIEGLQGEILNVYNENEFEKRMWNLYNHYVNIIETDKIRKLYFFDLADSIEGILRVSGLQCLKYGIVESTVKYSHFIANWLNKLSECVEIDYYGCLGNHDEIRPLGSKSGDFAKENMHIIISTILTSELKNNKRVTIHNSKKLQYVNIDGFYVLATHGQDEKNLIKSVKDYKELYNVKIDLMISGHLHNSKQETASLHTKVVQFPSVIGIDDYSLTLKKTAKPEGKAILIKDKRFISIDIEL